MIIYTLSGLDTCHQKCRGVTADHGRPSALQEPAQCRECHACHAVCDRVVCDSCVGVGRRRGRRSRSGRECTTENKNPTQRCGEKTGFHCFTASLFDHFVCRVSSQTLSMLRRRKTIRCSHYHFRSAPTLIPGVTREAVLRQETWFSFLSRKSESEHRYDPLRS